MKEKEMTMEESLNALDQIVEQMEEGETSLEETFLLYQKGMELLKNCSDKIRQTPQTNRKGRSAKWILRAIGSCFVLRVSRWPICSIGRAAQKSVNIDRFRGQGFAPYIRNTAVVGQNIGGRHRGGNASYCDPWHRAAGDGNQGNGQDTDSFDR